MTTRTNLHQAIIRFIVIALASLVIGSLGARPLDAGAATGLGGPQALSAAGDPVTADVWIVGDSITSRSYLDLLPLLTAKGYETAVNALGGRTTSQGIDWVLAQGRFPTILVMELGSNDTEIAPAVMAGQINRLKAVLPAMTKLIWVDVQVARVRYAAAVQLTDQRNSMWVNAQIYAAVPNVCKWSLGFATSPGRFSMYLKYDGVHPDVTTGSTTGPGTKYWAAVVAACIK